MKVDHDLNRCTPEFFELRAHAFARHARDRLDEILTGGRHFDHLELESAARMIARAETLLWAADGEREAQRREAT